MNKVLFQNFLNFVEEVINHDSKNDELLAIRFHELIDELRHYCSHSLDILDCYRLIRLLEAEMKLLLKRNYREDNSTLNISKISKALKVEKEIISYRITYPDLSSKITSSTVPSPVELIWTDSKVALVELMYSVARSFNHGALTMNQLAKGFEHCFNVKIGNHCDILNDINLRQEPAKYLSLLKRNLIEVLERINSR